MSDQTISGVLQQTVYVPAGERVRVLSGAVLQGTMDVDGTLVIERGGTVQGTLDVSCGAEVIIQGALQGTADVDAGGSIVVEASGSLHGVLNNDGSVTIRGRFGGPVSGNAVVLEGAGRVIEPEVRDGKTTYRL